MHSIQKEVFENINKYGQKCVVNGNIETKVIIKNLWQNNKTRFEAKTSQIGLCENDYYSVYFPFDCDITKLQKNAVAVIDDESFLFVKTEAVIVESTNIYNWAIMKKIQEGEDVFE